MSITLPTSDIQGMQIAEFDTTTLLEHAAKQARQRKYQDLFIVDVDSHHYETESQADINDYLDDPVLEHLAKASSGLKAVRTGFINSPGVGNQDQAGRVTRYPLRGTEKTDPGRHRDVELGHRRLRRDALGQRMPVRPVRGGDPVGDAQAEDFGVKRHRFMNIGDL